MSAAEFLAWEREQPEKHEFCRGEIFAMAGGSPRHNFLASAVLAELRAALRGMPCHVFSSDQRISAKEGERYVYADAVASCGGARMEPGTTDILANPCIVAEVLSPGTEVYDRGAKWEAYQGISSLTDYLLVSQTSVRVEHYQRQEDGWWRYRVFEAGGVVKLANGALLPVDAIYENAFDVAAG